MNKVLKELFSTGLYLLVVLVLSLLIIKFVGQRTCVEGSSMETTLSDGDNLWVYKLGYRFNDPERFDIVVFPYKYEDKTYYIKRVIGLPGETVQIMENGDIYVNGEILYESYGREIISAERLGLAAEMITLGEDEYFVLGDNRNFSKDSRYPDVGNVKKSEIMGKAVFRFWPLSGFGKIEK